MATGYEVEMYNNIKAIKQESQKQTQALESIAKSLEKIAQAVVADDEGAAVSITGYVTTT